MASCSGAFQYVHYEIDYPEKENKGASLKKEALLSSLKTADGEQVNMFPPQVTSLSGLETYIIFLNFWMP